MNLSFKQMRCLEAVERTGSIPVAAKELGISRMTINSAMDKFEREYGYSICERNAGRGLEATAEGRAAIATIREMLEDISKFEAELADLSAGRKGLFRFACYYPAAPRFLPIVLKDFLSLFPGIEVEVVTGFKGEIIEALLTGRAQIGLLHGGYRMPEMFDFETLLYTKPFAVLSEKDPLAAHRSVSFAQLAERPMIGLNHEAIREYYLDLFRKRGLKPFIAHSVRSVELARNLVGCGFGYALLNLRPRESAIRDLGLVLRPIRDEARGEPLGLATLSGIRLPPVARALLRHCRKLRDDGALESLTVKS